MRHFLVLGLGFYLGAVCFAGPADPILKLESTKLTGSYLSWGKRVELVPSDSVKCSIYLLPIPDHEAPRKFQGWRVLSKLEVPEGSIDHDFGIFWNTASFANPFTKGFDFEYVYYDPQETVPMKVHGLFVDADNVFKVIRHLSTVDTTFSFSLNADRSEATSVTIESTDPREGFSLECQK